MSPPRLLCTVLTLAACSAGAPAPAPPPVVAPPPLAAPPAPPRYVVSAPSWIERAGDGVDRVIANGRRMELRGMEIARLGPAAPELDGGARVPSWSPPGAPPYRFWKGRQLYAADSFDGELRPVGWLPAEPRRTFDWLGGVGFAFDGGGVVAPASGGAPVRLGVPPFGRAIAAGARRALVLTALGHAWLTLDGGASYRDATPEIGGALDVQVRGDALAALLPDGRERLVSPSGAVTDASPAGTAVGDTRRPPDEPDVFPAAPQSRVVDQAVRVGVPLPDGGAVIAGEGFVGRIDLATLRATSLTALDPGLAGAACAPIRTADALLLACADHERAVVVDLGGAPRTERTFDLAGAPELHRFVGVDGEALGYLGPCDGPAPPRDDLDAVVGGGEPYNASRQRTPVFCARAGRDAWIEHRLDAADAPDVIAWIPRPGGGAVALVARWGTLLDDRERVTVRGALRVVRVARNEPPFTISPYGWEAAAVLDRALRIGPDDAVEGWLAASGNSVGTLAVSIDARGHASALPAPPRAATITTAGRFALAQADDGKLWDTTDGGHRWTAVEPPPGARIGAPVSTCSLVGCRLGAYVRLGWSSPGVAASALGEAPPPEPPRPSRAPGRALVRLSCAFEGAPEGKRVADSAGFGYTSAPQPRGRVPVKLGQLGVATMPYNGTSMPLLGDLDLGWVAPLDTSAVMRRATVPVTRLGLAPGAPRVQEVRLGWLLTPGGGLATFPVGPPGPCLSGLLELPGISRALGGCASDPSVGVDLGGRVITVHPGEDTLVVSAADLPSRPAGPALPVAMRELHVTRVAGALVGFTFGVGARAGAPVLVALDRGGEASLAPIDPERGTLGAEERLRPLGEAALGSDPACAPRAGEATVVLPFEELIGVDREALRGISSTSSPGVAVLRWSRERACLDAVELPVRDERFDESQGPYEPLGTMRKVIARFGGRGVKRGATLLLVANGSEVRQRLSCTALRPGDGG